jgi:sterol 24-C-methyltransferase
MSVLRRLYKLWGFLFVCLRRENWKFRSYSARQLGPLNHPIANPARTTQTVKMATSATVTSHSEETQQAVQMPHQLKSYYYSWESRIGYRVMLGGTRHFGYWEKDTWWPFPISDSLRRMEDMMAQMIDLPKGSQVLDAGCGVGHVALRMAGKHGLRVTAIDIIDHHVVKAKANIARASDLPKGMVTAQQMDYHHLDPLKDKSFDGIYTMETFVHARDPPAVLAHFFRLLRPGGHLTSFEYDNDIPSETPKLFSESMRQVNEWAAMPMNDISHPGVLRRMLEDAGFVDVEVRDWSEHIRPMTRLFCLIAFFPYLFVRLFGLERYFINTVAGVGSYVGGKHWRYLAISARKPGEAGESAKAK